MNIVENQSLARFTTYRIGGSARWYAEVETAADLLEALAWAKACGTDCIVLGGGSNVLVDDGGVPGLVVRLTGEMAQVKVDAASGLLLCGAGARLKRVGREAASGGYGAYLFMTGIPGTVGGAVVVNAGTREGDIASVCEWVEAVGPDGAVARYKAEELAFGYRTSRFYGRGDFVVTRAAFRLGAAGDPQTVKASVRAHLLERKAREPKIRRNCGSVFKAAPDGTPAGALIDRAGLKGAKVGGAMIAKEHANWIVNTGGATAEEVRALVDLAHGRVLEIFGVDLQREVVYLPQDFKLHGTERV